MNIGVLSIGHDGVADLLLRISNKTPKSIADGLNDAAEFIMEDIIKRFGEYQSTGGNGNGAWKKLSSYTNERKMKLYGFTDKPLIATGAASRSFSRVNATKNNLSAEVKSSSEYLKYHVYGDGVPKRDPVFASATDNMQEIYDIIQRKLKDVVRR